MTARQATLPPQREECAARVAQIYSALAVAGEPKLRGGVSSTVQHRFTVVLAGKCKPRQNGKSTAVHCTECRCTKALAEAAQAPVRG